VIDKKSVTILVLIILFISSIEIVLHFLQPFLSKDLKHYKEMDLVLEKFNNCNKDKVLFIGNSLTREGIDTQLFSEQNKCIALIRPDDTTINEWAWIFKSKVSGRINIKELKIIFLGSQLKDKPLEVQNLVSISNLVSTNEIFEVIHLEDLDFSDSASLVLAHWSKVFSSRERVQRRILALLPKYKEQSRLINQSLVHAGTRTEDKIQKNRYRHLKMLIQLAQEKKVRITFIAAPLPKPYKIESNLLDIFDKYSSISFLDARKAWDIQDKDFQDGYHLNARGASKFTKYILDNDKKYQRKINDF